MRKSCTIHEPLMNPSGMILPRVGGGVGGRGGWGVKDIGTTPFNLTVGATSALPFPTQNGKSINGGGGR